MEVLWGPIAAAPAMRRSIGMPKRTPKTSATDWISTIRTRHSSRVAGSPVMRSRVAPVRTLIGLKVALPHSLTQTSLRMCRRTGATSRARPSASDSRRQRAESEPSGSPRLKRSSEWWTTRPGSGTSLAA
jgi:hypothetical protein